MHFKRINQLLAIVICLGLATPALAITYKVTNANDNGPGSLRQAIIDAQASPGKDTIVFTGDFSIFPTTLLPTITDPLIILGDGRNVTLDGSAYKAANAVTCPCQSAGNPAHPALNFDGANGSSVVGLTIKNWCDGILVRNVEKGVWKDNKFSANLGNAQLDFFNSKNNTTTGNDFKQDTSLALGQCSGDNIELNASTDNYFSNNKFVGGENAYELLANSNNNTMANEYIENSFRGAIELSGSGSNKVLNSVIKNSVVHPNPAFAALGSAIFIVRSSSNVVEGNTISGIPAGSGVALVADPTSPLRNDSNLIKDNNISNVSSAGVLVTGGHYNTVTVNRIKDVGGIGIDLSDATFLLLGIVPRGAPDGVTPNNTVMMANDGQNYPVMNDTLYKWTGASIKLQGTLQGNNILPGQKYKIECFGNLAPEREAAEYLGSTMTTVSPDGIAYIQFHGKAKFNSNEIYVTCTATAENGNTSELSAPIKVVSDTPQI